jgi:hypothetical protein
MTKELEFSIANLSYLFEDENFLLQVSRKSDRLSEFIKSNVPASEKAWLSDFKSWEIKNNWLKSIGNICIDEYDQVFFDMGEDLFDLKDAKNYKDYKEKVLDKLEDGSLEP